MARGGKRPGAGRKPGVPAQKTINRLKIAEEAATGGITPLEVMLTQMRKYWDANTDDGRAKACEIAKDAAPYLHPRLSAVDSNINADNSLVVKVVKFAQDAIAAEEADEPIAISH